MIEGAAGSRSNTERISSPACLSRNMYTLTNGRRWLVLPNVPRREKSLQMRGESTAIKGLEARAGFEPNG